MKSGYKTKHNREKKYKKDLINRHRKITTKKDKVLH